MPRTIPVEFSTEKNKLENRPVHLITVHDYDGGGNNLTWAEHDADVVFIGVTYYKFPVTFDLVPESSSGQVDRVNMVVENVSRLVQSYLEDYDWRGLKVSIKTVWLDQLADMDNYIEDVFYVDSYTADQMNVSIALTSKFDVLDISLPARVYSRNYCQWKFKGVECGYVGATSTCNKTKATCKTLLNFSRFGGFPSIQSNRVALG